MPATLGYISDQRMLNNITNISQMIDIVAKSTPQYHFWQSYMILAYIEQM